MLFPELFQNLPDVEVGRISKHYGIYTMLFSSLSKNDENP